MGEDETAEVIIRTLIRIFNTKLMFEAITFPFMDDHNENMIITVLNCQALAHSNSLI